MTKLDELEFIQTYRQRFSRAGIPPVPQPGRTKFVTIGAGGWATESAAQQPFFYLSDLTSLPLWSGILSKPYALTIMSVVSAKNSLSNVRRRGACVFQVLM